MAHFVGLDVSVKETSVCVVDDTGKVILEQKVTTEPDAIIALLPSKIDGLVTGCLWRSAQPS
jgi:transposase